MEEGKDSRCRRGRKIGGWKDRRMVDRKDRWWKRYNVVGEG